jgi:hypothetical protein
VIASEVGRVGDPLLTAWPSVAKMRPAFEGNLSTPENNVDLPATMKRPRVARQPQIGPEKRKVAIALGIAFAFAGIICVVIAGKDVLAGRGRDGFNDVFLALTLLFVALAMTQIFTPNAALPASARDQEPRFSLQASRDIQVRALIFDGLSLGIALLSLLGMIILASINTTPQVYPALHSGFVENDYYRYVNMALDHGDPRYVYAQPFLYRVLVPSTVHLLSHLGIPFRTGFYGNTIFGLVVSTVTLFFLARGAGLSRFASTCTSIVFTMLSWTVTYNISDYFLIDTTTEAFIATIVLAVQRRQFIPAIILGTIGVACKESIYLPIAFAAIHLMVPYLSPLSTTLGQVLQLRVTQVIRMIPNRTWVLLAFQVICPLLVTAALHTFIPLAHPVGLLTLWRFYLHAHLAFGVRNTIASSLWYTFGIMLFLAMGALALRLWPRARWSGWGLFAVLGIIIYSFAVSGDSQRLSVIGWPFLLVLAALMIDELSRRLHISEYLLWPLVIVIMLLNFPPDPNSGHFQPTTFAGYILLHLDWRLEATLLCVAIAGLLVLLSSWIWRDTGLRFSPSNAANIGELH